jgi:hypothetical protein
MAGLVLLAAAQPAFARAFRVNMIPNGFVFGCANCHLSSGGGGARNAFGNDVYAVVQGPSSTAFWSTVYNKDSDGDGFTNGRELGDPNGTGTPIPGAQVTNPGDASSHPVIINQPPAVTLTGPANGAVFNAPADIALSADASDTDGSIAQVQFFEGVNSLGIATSQPFSMVWSNVPAGTYSLSATAMDNLGAQKTSDPVTILVRVPPPPVRFDPIQWNATDVTLVWTGGTGPFEVQGSTNLSKNVWTPVSTTTNRTASILRGAQQAFFRIVDMGTKP